MGICASCLGGGQPQDPVEQDEVDSGPLLFSVPNGMHYGSFAEPHSDPARAQRETEALQRVVTRTSEGMADIYDTTTPGAHLQHQPGFARDRQAQYQFLLTKVNSNVTCASVGSSISTDEEDDAPLRGGFTHIEAGDRKSLVGTFREAATAMA